MRINPNKVDEILVSIVGEEGLVLTKYLYGKENVSEFDLANKTKKDIKIIRKMLYFLYNHNLVAFTRKKDKDKGWYIYYWTLLPENVMFLYVKRKREELANLKHKIEQSGKELFFTCKNKCVQLNFDQAMEFEFHCPECGELVMQDVCEDVEILKKKAKEIEEELSSVKEKPSKKAVKTKTVVKVKKALTKKTNTTQKSKPKASKPVKKKSKK
jgi:transcription initiation factor TFIIE subunit alpha